jgi:hypothetical protein
MKDPPSLSPPDVCTFACELLRVKKFDYRPPSLASMKVRLEGYVNKERFKAALARAQRGETSDLQDYLRSQAGLDANQRYELAALIDQHIQNKKRGRGRPRGSRHLPEREMLIRWVVKDMQSSKKRWRVRHPDRKQLPKGRLDQMIRDVCERFVENGTFDEYGVECDVKFLKDVRARVDHKSSS